MAKLGFDNGMSEFHTQGKENVGSLLRRFVTRLKKSGVPDEAKKALRRQKSLTRRQRKVSALSRLERKKIFDAKRRQAL